MRKLIVTEEQRKQVRELYETHTQCEIAKLLGMNQATVSRCIGNTGSRRIPMTELFTVEKGIPLPPKAMPSKWVLPPLSVGDSFVVPNSHVRSTLMEKALSIGHKCASRKLPEGKFRIWRTK